MSETREIIKRLTRRVVARTAAEIMDKSDLIAEGLCDELSAECPGDRLYVDHGGARQQRNAQLRARYAELTQRHDRTYALRALQLQSGLSQRQLKRICQSVDASS
jgi:hypothetical protein